MTSRFKLSDDFKAYLMAIASSGLFIYFVIWPAYRAICLTLFAWRDK
jgi:hypothetical protein